MKDSRMIKVDSTFVDRSITFVRTAIETALTTDRTFGMKSRDGIDEHVGTADLVSTSIALQMFSIDSALVVVEESLPPFSQWISTRPIILVDPLDGSAEAGTGGTQVAAAVSVYDAGGIPIFAAAASPGLRPVFRISENSFAGFSNTVGTILFGGPDGVFMLPLNCAPDITPLLVPQVQPLLPFESAYTSIALDLNFPAPCGFQKGFSRIKSGLIRMPFSTVFCQMQAILGQTNAITFGPVSDPLVTASWRQQHGPYAFDGPKAWDFIMPLAIGAGLEYRTLDGQTINCLSPDFFTESYVMRRRLILSHPRSWDYYASEITELLQI
jgi:hypothetical protein